VRSIEKNSIVSSVTYIASKANPLCKYIEVSQMQTLVTTSKHGCAILSGSALQSSRHVSNDYFEQPTRVLEECCLFRQTCGAAAGRSRTTMKSGACTPSGGTSPYGGCTLQSTAPCSLRRSLVACRGGCKPSLSTRLICRSLFLLPRRRCWRVSAGAPPPDGEAAADDLPQRCNPSPAGHRYRLC